MALSDTAFALAFLKARGSAFQDLFSEIMERAFPSDFQRIRPHGSAGDLKCDGYQRSTQTVYQVYAPDDMRPLNRLLRKIDTDFAGAVNHWNGRLQRWVFVHNSRGGLPAHAIQYLHRLGASAGAPSIETWGYPELRGIVAAIPAERLVGLLAADGKSEDLARSGSLPAAGDTECYWHWLTRLPVLVTPGTDDDSPSFELPLHLLRAQDLRRVQKHDQDISDHHAADTTGWRTGSTADGMFANVARVDLHDALRRHIRLLVVGDAGSGKSTMLRRFAVAEATRLSNLTREMATRQTPVLVELWRFGPDRSLWDLIDASVRRSQRLISRPQLAAATERGYVTLLFDGLDEVPSSFRRECLAQLMAIGDEYPRARIVVATRPLADPPNSFEAFHLAPLSDSLIVAALHARFGSTKAFRRRFPPLTPDDYVRVEMGPEVRQLCRLPLTLRLVLSLLSADGKLPDRLFAIYDRFLAQLLDWQTKRGGLRSTATATNLAMNAAYATISDARSVLITDARLSAGGPQSIDRDEVLQALVAAGIVLTHDGAITFSHRTFAEFLAARRILASSSPCHDPLALNSGVARFLCGVLPNVSDLLERHFVRCEDAQALMPLLKQVDFDEQHTGRFEALYYAIVDAQDMAIHLTHYLTGPDEDEFTDRVEDLVATCLAFQPKTLVILKLAADGVINGLHWTNSRRWLELILVGLDACSWPGARLHRRLIDIGFFEYVDCLSDDNEDDLQHGAELLDAYLEAVYHDDFATASTHLDEIAHDITSRRSEL